MFFVNDSLVVEKHDNFDGGFEDFQHYTAVTHWRKSLAYAWRINIRGDTKGTPRQRQLT